MSISLEAVVKRKCMDAELSKEITINSNNFESSLIEKSLKTSSKDDWIKLYHILNNSLPLRNLLVKNINHLFVSKHRFSLIKNKDPTFEKLVNTFESKNCLKAISALQDLSKLKINQYKFLYKEFKLGQAVKLMIRETIFLSNSVIKKDDPDKEIKRIVKNWIEMLIFIHSIPEEISQKFVQVCLETVHLILNKSNSKKVSIV